MIYSPKLLKAKPFARLLTGIKKRGHEFVLLGDCAKIHTGYYLGERLEKLGS